LVDRNTLVCVSNIGTTVNDTPFGHFKAKTLEVASTCNTKANEREEHVPPTQALTVNFDCATFFKNDRI
jgi:hypothetical protein